jgi:hypothetical protein
MAMKRPSGVIDPSESSAGPVHTCRAASALLERAVERREPLARLGRNRGLVRVALRDLLVQLPCLRLPELLVALGHVKQRRGGDCSVAAVIRDDLPVGLDRPLQIPLDLFLVPRGLELDVGRGLSECQDRAEHQTCHQFRFHVSLLVEEARPRVSHP